MEWKIPAKNNTLERVRARAYYHAYSAYWGYLQTLQALEMVKKGETKVWNAYKKPKEGFGVGMVEGMRGGVAHWVVMQKGLIHRYQIITPTAWDISPRDDQNRPGPYEASIINSKITEPVNGDKLTGIDVVRTIHSYDPCLGCTVQIFNPEDQLVATHELSHIHADDVFEREFGE
jgi:hydrogenase large subunit